MTESKHIAGSGGGGGVSPETLLCQSLVALKQLKIFRLAILFAVLTIRARYIRAKFLKFTSTRTSALLDTRLWNQCLDATPNHWVLNQFNAFVEIGTLDSDDCLEDEFGHLRPIVDRTELGEHTVYNLTVEGHHTFIANSVRVHNAGLGARIAGSGGGGGGKGGGGGSSHTPTEADDSLQSKQFANALDLLSEGEIEGLDDGNKHLF